MDRLAMLNEILSQNPDDAFARYGLAMEYSKTGDVERALERVRKVAVHPSRLHSRIFHGCADAIESKSTRRSEENVG